MFLLKKIYRIYTGYFDSKKYWKRRLYLNQPYKSGLLKNIRRGICFVYCKRIENKNNCSMGTSFHGGAVFVDQPIMPHGITGIFISRKSIIESSVTILQHTTIGSRHYQSPVIKKNCVIGTGARVLGGIVVNENVNIGANAVVIRDIEAYSTVVPAYPRIISRTEKKIIRF